MEFQISMMFLSRIEKFDAQVFASISFDFTFSIPIYFFLRFDHNLCWTSNRVAVLWILLVEFLHYNATVELLCMC